MELETGYHEPTQGDPAMNPVTVPPTAMPLPGLVTSEQTVRIGPAGQTGHVEQTGQAQAVQWIPTPLIIPTCPPGLEYLCQLDQILVHQQVEVLEVLTGIETQNRYKIKNSVGQQIFYAKEQSDFLQRQYLGGGRAFTICLLNNANQEVMRVVRPSPNCAGWLTVAVEAPVGQLIGHVSKRGSLWCSYLEVLDASLKPILKIRGPCCYCQGAGDIDFRVMTPDESQQIGKISKQWAGYIQETYTTADNFCITFPVDLDVKAKATLLGALFLMDFMLFERRPTHNNQVPR